MTGEEILSKVESEKIKYVLLQVSDINGVLKGVGIPADELEGSLKRGTMFDGSSIEGFVRINESDMFLRPDLNTFAILPWTKNGDKVARIICDVFKSDGTPFEGDPRFVLRKVVKKLEECGFKGYAGPEPEFFLLPRDENTHKPKREFMDEGGYFDLLPIDLGGETRKAIVEGLEDMGINVEASHHEVAPSQHEIDFTYDEILNTADNIQTFKLVVKTMSLLKGVHATFMPKPFFGINGSGMHTHMSIFSKGENIFYDEKGEYGLSQELKYFIGGIFQHIKAITAIANPTVNSYKRLVPGYEAPTNVAWSASNRSALVRVPAPRGKGTRAELRSPDPTANPYLLIAVCFACGLNGIKEKIDPPKAVVDNIYHMTEEQKKDFGIFTLPGSLREALEELKKDEFVKDVLGEHITEKFIELKEKECKEFEIAVTDWETAKYFETF
ncbi:MAG TPA: type I glutamate--ammonia ligase [Tepiditoga sp.]|nr:type I glutamate--ammonia ligase [Tepiditoga sp.]